MLTDASNGWEAAAREFIQSRSNVGLDVIKKWATSLPRGGSILDIGAGSGVPLAEAMLADGFAVSAVDASPTLIAEFRRRFPNAAAACEPAESSPFFDSTFDGIMAIGLIFLLPVANQRELIQRVPAALNPQGRFLFSAPRQICNWHDTLTGRASQSLGAEEYTLLLREAGLRIVGNHLDEGGNYYYEAGRIDE